MNDNRDYSSRTTESVRVASRGLNYHNRKPPKQSHFSIRKKKPNFKSLEKNNKGEGYKVKYTLLLSIGEHEGVEKNGDMIIIEGGDKGFTIAYDWETMIIIDKFQFR